MQLTFAMLPLKNGDIAIVYDQNMNFRHIDMNGVHPTNLMPSPMGNSVGHWEATRWSSTQWVSERRFYPDDRFGTPQSEAMHIVERYRLIDGAVAKTQIDKYETSEGSVSAGRATRATIPIQA